MHYFQAHKLSNLRPAERKPPTRNLIKSSACFWSVQKLKIIPNTPYIEGTKNYIGYESHVAP